MMSNRTSLEAYLDANGELVYSNLGTSMLPLLRQGRDLVIIEKKTSPGCRPGDVVLYKRKSGQLVLHRIVGKDESGYILLGDNRAVKEHGVHEESISGIMKGFVRNGKTRLVSSLSYKLYTFFILHSLALRKPFIKLYGIRRRARAQKKAASATDKRAVDAMLYLVSCALTGAQAETEKIDGMNLYAVLAEAKKRMMVSLAGYALEKAGKSTPAFNEARAKALRKCALLASAREKIVAEFESRGIEYMLLKGAVISDYYPGFGLREMTDNDILIDSSRAEEVREIMTSLGYDVIHFGESAHDVYHMPPVISFEMHRSLFEAKHGEKLCGYYSDIFTRLVRNEIGCGYHFTAEDFYIFLIAHFYKHYSRAGAGLRPLADIYVWLNKNGAGMDMAYISAELEKLGMIDFEGDMRRLALAVFGAGTLTPEDEKNLGYLINSGNFGNTVNRVNNGVRHSGGGLKGKIRYALGRVFLPREAIKKQFPFFARHRVLIPLLPLYRAFLRPSRAFYELKALFRNRAGRK